MIKVTVLITNYNYKKYLRRCIRSCLGQSMSREFYEIIIVDDCSTDGSQSLLMDYSDFENIKVIYNKDNLGLGASCRLGAERAMGQYIVRVDADDYVNEDFVKFLYVYASLNKSFAVSCDYLKVDPSEVTLSREGAEENPIACGVMFKTDVLHEVGSYSNLRIHEEKHLLERFLKMYKMDYLKVPLYRYHIHDESMTFCDKK